MRSSDTGWRHARQSPDLSLDTITKIKPLRKIVYFIYDMHAGLESYTSFARYTLTSFSIVQGKKKCLYA